VNRGSSQLVHLTYSKGPFSRSQKSNLLGSTHPTIAIEIAPSNPPLDCKQKTPPRSILGGGEDEKQSTPSPYGRHPFNGRH
jgi:hypothetical protein